MTSRREEVVAAAIRVLAEGGSRGLTHRAVDAAAQVPAGTTSNHFRSRAALVTAVAEALEQHDRDLLPAPAGATGLPTTPEGVAELAARFVRAAVDDPRPQRARLALAVEPGVDLSPQHDRLRALAGELLAAAGIADAARARPVMDYLDGVLLHALTISTRQVDEAEVARSVARLLS